MFPSLRQHSQIIRVATAEQMAQTLAISPRKGSSLVTE